MLGGRSPGKKKQEVWMSFVRSIDQFHAFFLPCFFSPLLGFSGVVRTSTCLLNVSFLRACMTHLPLTSNSNTLTVKLE